MTSSSSPSTGGRWSRADPGTKAAIIAGVFALLVAILTAALSHGFGLIGGDDEKKKSDPSCQVGDRVTLLTDLATGGVFDINVNVLCPPEEGEKYVLISEIPTLGASQQPAFYRKSNIKPVIGPVTVHMDLGPSAPIGSTRKLYVVSVNARQDKELGTNLALDSSRKSLPEGVVPVSNIVPHTRNS